MSKDSSGFTKHAKNQYGPDALGEPAFTIYPSGSGRFNRAALREYFDEDVDRITYYTDTGANELGLSLGGTDDGYKLTHEESGGAEASIRSVIQKFGVQPDDLEETHTLDIEDRRGQAGLLVVDVTPVLKDGGQA